MHTVAEPFSTGDHNSSCQVIIDLKYTQYSLEGIGHDIRWDRVIEGPAPNKFSGNFLKDRELPILSDVISLLVD